MEVSPRNALRSLRGRTCADASKKVRWVSCVRRPSSGNPRHRGATLCCAPVLLVQLPWRACYISQSHHLLMRRSAPAANDSNIWITMATVRTLWTISRVAVSNAFLPRTGRGAGNGTPTSRCQQSCARHGAGCPDINLTEGSHDRQSIVSCGDLVSIKHVCGAAVYATALDGDATLCRGQLRCCQDEPTGFACAGLCTVPGRQIHERISGRRIVQGRPSALLQVLHRGDEHAFDTTAIWGSDVALYAFQGATPSVCVTTVNTQTDTAPVARAWLRASHAVHGHHEWPHSTGAAAVSAGHQCSSDGIAGPSPAAAPASS